MSCDFIDYDREQLSIFYKQMMPPRMFLRMILECMILQVSEIDTFF